MTTLIRVMVIDDNEADQFLAKTLIEDFNPDIEIIQATDGQEALDLLNEIENKPDVILLDINMPVMDGHEFLEHYEKTDHKMAVFIMLASSDQDIDIERASVYGFVKRYFTKPIDNENLLEIQNTYL